MPRLCGRLSSEMAARFLWATDAGPTTPTTTAAVHRFDELTAEVSGMQRKSRKPFRRDSTRIQQWVVDQQLLQQSTADDPPDTPDSTEPPAPSSGCHPYLAYPHLSQSSILSAKHGRIEESSSECFVLVEESDDMPLPGRDAFNSHKVRHTRDLVVNFIE